MIERLLAKIDVRMYATQERMNANTKANKDDLLERMDANTTAMHEKWRGR
jgi:hypothetical protein